ncbi:FtsK/SpoIIIE domain-containing protein [Actinacidiphila bryophytorum]|uniref:FtsK/SpoIIIE domain-containing protein n=1 Tax=Actinacidiphila bryophytorum TaxID=1436133 RepID=UPI002176C67F|nr:FtsK/SpoIIIE domain-containing protein [Actinacidiphila bryophytorum]UWE11452.1 FtsK/SpoIIIE domain-containing protein [Actinacidiphila bryophytorum]
MRRLLTVVMGDGAEHDVELAAPESEMMVGLAAHFAGRWGVPQQDAEADTGVRPFGTLLRYPGSTAPMLFAGEDALPALMTLGESPLRDGIRVGLGMGLDEPAAGGNAVVEIVAGEGAGRRRPANLPADPPVAYDDMALAELLDVRTGYPHWIFRLDGFPARRDAEWSAGALLEVGGRCLRWRPRSQAVPAQLPEGEGGTLLFARPPRHTPAPLSAGIAYAAPVRWWFGAAVMNERARKARITRRGRIATEIAATVPSAWWGRQVADAELAGKTVTGVAQELARAYPAASEVRDIALLRDDRLWERRRTDRDFLALRCGLRTSADHRGESVELGADSCPAVVDLPMRGVVGVVGAGDRPRRLAGWLALQAAVHHSPDDVVLRVLTDSAGAADWRWLRWLPRSSTALDDGGAPRVYADPTSVARQIGVLLQLLADRRSAVEAKAAASPLTGVLTDMRLVDALLVQAADRTSHVPAVVLVLDGVRRLRTLPGVGRLLQEGPAVGVYVVCLGEEVRHLPAGCDWLLDTGAEGGPRVVADGVSYPLVPDLPDKDFFEEPARALAPLRDADTVQRALDLADRPLAELLGLERPDDALPIAARWSAVPRSTTAVVGQADALPFELDLRTHGPHALVAGAAGSGRREFLCSWIASLAVANRPDEMLFVLVDYKGGAFFEPVIDLPHVTSLVVDLDARQAERILGRLQAALRSREAQLGTYKARDIDEYQDMRDRGRDLPPLPRLVFVIAEYAALAREIPALVAGLVNLAQRGRSLGVHLVLATQRPGGPPAADIRSATNLRIALRLGSAEESAAVIDAPDAAAIPGSSPGRAFLRTGAEELHEFQAAMPVGTGQHRPADRTVTTTDLDDRPYYLPVAPAAGPLVAISGQSDLGLLVSAVRSAAQIARVPTVPGPLPEPLPMVVTLSELPPPEGEVRDLAPVAYAVAELADEPGRLPVLFDPLAGGTLAAVGAPRSGRSQFLRTLAAALAVRHSSADVHLFCIDCGTGALQALSRLPHCGAVVTRGRPDHMARLAGRLTAALYSRQQLFAEGGFGDIAAQRQAVPQERRLPYLVLLLDQWEAFCDFAERDGGRMRDDLGLLMAEGARAGIRVVMTGDGPESFRPTSTVDDPDLLVLDQRSAAAYRDLGVEAPYGRLEPGRALRAFSSVELQIALLDGEPTSRGQSDALDRLAQELRTRDAHIPHPQRPFTIDDAPRAAESFHVGPGKGRPVGREDVLAWLRDRHATGASAALLGPRRAGKTWVLEELSRRLAAEGGHREVHRLVVPPAQSPVDDPDVLAGILDRGVREAASPAEALLDKAASAAAGAGPAYLLDEVGRLADYGAAAVSWLRDLGQAGAWLLYTGTEKDWRTVVRWALTAPGSSFGNDVNARLLGPLDRDAALDFLSGTAANLGVALGRDTTAADVVATVGSWPFYLQVAGDAVVRAVQGNDLSPLSGPGAVRALTERRLLDEWTLHFQSRWAEIGPAGRAALLTAPGTMPLDASPAQREDLREVGLLRPGEEWLSDPPLLDWIARNEISLRDGESGELSA